jgi:hypothetical protein
MSIAQEYDGSKLGGPGLIIAMRIEQHFGVEEQTIEQDQVPLPTNREQAMAMLRVATFYLDTQK